MAPTLSTTRSLSPTRAVLSNGAVVIAKHTRKTPAAAINVAIRAGSVCDPVQAPGTMHLLGRVIDRGTVNRSASEIAEELDGRGISLSIQVNRHLFSLVCTCLAEDFQAVLALIGDIVRSPSIPPSELETRKGEVITGIRQDEDNPAVRAFESLMALLYGEEHPYGRRVKGTIEVVERISREDLLGVHRVRFAPSGATLVVVGDVEPEEVSEAAGRAVGSWRASAAPPPIAIPPVPPLVSRRQVVIPMMNKIQADIAYGFTAIKRSDPTYYACWLMNVILGQYAMGGRLGDSIRERQGMAYYASSALDASVIEGPLVIRAGVSPANVERTIASIDEELNALGRDGVKAKELDESRQYLIGSMPRALETNAGIAGFLQSAEFFHLGGDYDQRLPALLGAVSLEDVNAAARRLLDPARASVVVAGPYEP